MDVTKRPWTAIKRMAGVVNIEVSALDMRSVIARIRDDELCPEHGGNYEANARLIVLAVNHFEEMREAANALCAAVRLAPTDRVAAGVDEDLAIRTQYFMAQIDALSALIKRVKGE